MSTRLKPVLSTGDLPLAELSSIRLDGEVFVLGDGWCPIDEVDDATTRALAAGLLVPPRAIAERMTAAWILGAAPEPRQHQFCVDVDARAHIPLNRRIQVREVRGRAEDRVMLGGLRVTTPLRTLIDLARFPPDPSPGGAAEVVPVLSALIVCTGADAADAAACLRDLPRAGHRGVALLRLEQALRLLEADGVSCRCP